MRPRLLVRGKINFLDFVRYSDLFHESMNADRAGAGGIV
jgi:hypothetical protein